MFFSTPAKQPSDSAECRPPNGSPPRRAECRGRVALCPRGARNGSADCCHTRRARRAAGGRGGPLAARASREPPRTAARPSPEPLDAARSARLGRRVACARAATSHAESGWSHSNLCGWGGVRLGGDCLRDPLVRSAAQRCRSAQGGAQASPWWWLGPLGGRAFHFGRMMNLRRRVAASSTSRRSAVSVRKSHDEQPHSHIDGALVSRLMSGCR